MSETTVTVMVEDFAVKEGAKDGKPWKKIGLKDANGEYYSTFDAALGQRVIDLKGQRATITWKPSKNPAYKDLTAIAPLEEPALPTSQAPDGGADWDTIGLRKTRCLLWANYLQSPLAAQVAAEDHGAQPAADRVFNLGAALVLMAESDIYHRAPATEDARLPF